MISALKLIIGIILISCFTILLLHVLNETTYVACKTKEAIIDKPQFIVDNGIIFKKTPHMATIDNTNIYIDNIGNGILFSIAILCIVLVSLTITINMMNIIPTAIKPFVIIFISIACFSIVFDKLTFHMNRMCIATMNNELIQTTANYLECSCAPKLSFDKSIVSCACSPSFDRNLYILKQYNDMG